MLGSTSGLVVSSSEGVSSAHEVAAAAAAAGSSSIMSGGDGGGEGEFYEGDRSTGGNRWPRQETLALLKIRSDMDAVFRDSSIKGPLWDQISRKMSELGYHRSSKKCKEKFENVYKYHKRTKDGRVGKSDGKTYRFFDQLEALEQHQLSLSPLGTPRGQPAAHAAVPVTMVIPANVTVTSSIVHTQQVHSHQHPMINVVQHRPMAGQHGSGSPIQIGGHESSPSATPSSSSLSGSDEEVAGIGRSRSRRKRKWKEFFERLTKEVIYKQEELQSKFLEAVEKRDRDRFVREEAWKAQEVARLSREHEILVQERSMAAAKDAALMAFLQKLSDQQQIPLPLPIQIQTQTHNHTQTRGLVAPVVTTIVTPATQPPPPPQPQVTRVQENPVSLAIPVPIPPVQASPVQPQPQPLSQMPPVEYHKPKNIVGDNQSQASPSRWPKTEVEALINLRTQLDEKYQENGPKGPLWEEISSLMTNLGYNRNAKRCKEKWENINKYFKKVKESNKRRPEDSKTCPYFHQLDSLYRGKTSKTDINTTPNPNIFNTNPIMARPEQQWPSQDHLHRIGVGVEEDGSEDDDSDDDGDGDGDDEDDEEGTTDGYEIVANNNNAAATKTTTE